MGRDDDFRREGGSFLHNRLGISHRDAQRGFEDERGAWM